MRQFHLAQLNIATAIDDIESEALAPFVALLDEINALAEESPGFVWRLQEEIGDGSSIDGYENPRVIVNMSVWEDVGPLMDYVYKSAHAKVMARRREWFDVMKEAYHVLWWVDAGAEPTLAEAKARLEYLRAHGPTDHAFTFKQQFQKPVAA